MWVFAIIPAIYTAVMYRSIPDTMPMHFGIDGTVDRWGSKSQLILLVAVFLLAAAVITFNVISFEKKAEKTDDEKAKAGYLNNALVTTIIGFTVMVFTTVAYVLIIPEGIKMVSEGRDVISFDITKIVFVAMGILFLIIGNYMPKTRRNSVVGIRCKWTRYNDATWSKSNRFASYLTVAVGVIAIVLSLTMSDVMMAGLITVALTAVICIASLVYAHKIYVQEVNFGKDRD